MSEHDTGAKRPSTPYDLRELGNRLSKTTTRHLRARTTKESDSAGDVRFRSPGTEPEMLLHIRAVTFTDISQETIEAVRLVLPRCEGPKGYYANHLLNRRMG